MSAVPRAANPVTRGVRWLARGLSLVVAGMVVLFFLGSGGVNPMKLSVRESVLMMLFFTACLGLLIAWRWELLGAVMIIAGIVLFFPVELFTTGRFPTLWAFGVIALPGVLFMYCQLKELKLAAERLKNHASAQH